MSEERSGGAGSPPTATSTSPGGIAAGERLIRFVDASPTPFHAVATVVATLRAQGFTELHESDAWSVLPGGRHYVVRGESTLFAFVVGRRSPALGGFRLIGAHTDSPTLRLKPRAALTSAGHHQLGVEVYGGVLLATWLDRDLSVAGRVLLDQVRGVESVRVDLERPFARISNLAIHLDRKVNAEGLKLNEQRHLPPSIALESADCTSVDVEGLVARALGVDARAILGHDLVLYDTQRGALGGLHQEFVYSPRLDNLASCFAATEAIASVGEAGDATVGAVLYDHEECGSRSAVGAGGSFLRDVLARIAAGHPDAQAEVWPRALARSFLVSADMAHAVHPNHPDRHDAQHGPRLNRGLVIKHNANQSYATSGATAADLRALCRATGYTAQEFVVRTDVPCGSTIGPIVSAQLGIRTVDVGAPMLSMHSCREVAGSEDARLAVETYRRLFD
ncbi:MAG: M18 family aminopeptidase [Deltaproteobacteria bacterium]|nr:M18 family aminopeptidase [Deltaproteobacteria bacterium]